MEITNITSHDVTLSCFVQYERRTKTCDLRICKKLVNIIVQSILGFSKVLFL